MGHWFNDSSPGRCAHLPEDLHVGSRAVSADNERVRSSRGRSTSQPAANDPRSGHPWPEHCICAGLHREPTRLPGRAISDRPRERGAGGRSLRCPAVPPGGETSSRKDPSGEGAFGQTLLAWSRATGDLGRCCHNGHRPVAGPRGSPQHDQVVGRSAHRAFARPTARLGGPPGRVPIRLRGGGSLVERPSIAGRQDLGVGNCGGRGGAGRRIVVVPRSASVTSLSGVGDRAFAVAARQLDLPPSTLRSGHTRPLHRRDSLPSTDQPVPGWLAHSSSPERLRNGPWGRPRLFHLQRRRLRPRAPDARPPCAAATSD